MRNLRIREDTAKYLLNLDLQSAHYDPKSRSMREDPQPNKAPHEKAFLGDNFTRHSGDFHEFQALTMHSINAQDKGQAIHPQASSPLPILPQPIVSELCDMGVAKRRAPPRKQRRCTCNFRRRRSTCSARTRMRSRINTVTRPCMQIRMRSGCCWGRRRHMWNIMHRHEFWPPRWALVVCSCSKWPQRLTPQHNCEYCGPVQGRVIKGQEAKARSRYEEDARINNHTSIFGSWWSDGVWGYACCHQMVKNSYCTGTAGEQAQKDSLAQMQENMAAKAEQPASTVEVACSINDPVCSDDNAWVLIRTSPLPCP